MLKLTVNSGVDVKLNRLTFNGGEEHVRIEVPERSKRFDERVWQITLEAHLTSSKEVMAMFTTLDAIASLWPDKPVTLIMPYFPYARQDRVCNKGETHGVRMFATLLNSYMWMIHKVVVVDPHSDVVEAMFPAGKLKIIKQEYAFGSVMSINKELTTKLTNSKAVLVIPDAGAAKKSMEVAKAHSLPTVQANKVRDTETGEIVRTEVNCKDNDLDGCDIFIVDDICDGGRTFHELAKAIKTNHKVKSITLFVTHGIFSKGEKFSEYIDSVACRYNYKRGESCTVS